MNSSPAVARAGKRPRLNPGPLYCLVGLDHGVANLFAQAGRQHGRESAGIRIVFDRDEAPISFSVSKYWMINTRFITSFAGMASEESGRSLFRVGFGLGLVDRRDDVIAADVR